MANLVLFRCPVTGHMVQGEIEEDKIPRNDGMRHYVGVHCWCALRRLSKRASVQSRRWPIDVGGN